MRNVFLYWTGKDYKLIKVLRELIYKHSKSGKGYNVIFMNEKTVSNYISIPDYFSSLKPAHQADYIRVMCISKYGGIWLDSDTIVMGALDSLFDIIESNETDGFFMLENNEILFNGVFGSKPNTNLMNYWKERVISILNEYKSSIEWTQIGNQCLMNIKDWTNYFDRYKIFNGLNTMYPVNYDNCVEQFLESPYVNYKNLIKSYQPLVVIVNSVYIYMESLSEEEIRFGKRPINYFISSSFVRDLMKK
jgi:hypothetical protein